MVDRFRLSVLPVVLGAGARLFEGVELRLDVASSTTSRTGIITVEYRVR